MTSTKKVKIALLGAFILLTLVWAVSGTFSKAVLSNTAEAISVLPIANADDFVGSETCKACHEDQFKNVAMSKHGKLSEDPKWKDNVQGCESCHGGGKAHVEGGGDKTKIISFAGKNSKQISETCLACHSGTESHNNFRRGEHWRNDIGCTDCHTAHGPSEKNMMPGSGTFINESSKQNPTTVAMLKQSEPQLCISCHTETKGQFSKPFHHKVLEGTMKCSDCHNAHGGFEAKQTKLAIGGDAACIKCHTDKQGPFVFEHAPLKTEGCASCHTPHGSSNPKLLKRNNIRQLCMECHSGIADVESGAPQAPHNQATTRYNNCTVCHAKIHGSNASTFFFR